MTLNEKIAEALSRIHALTNGANIVQSNQMREIKSPIIQKIIAALKNTTID